ncbi:hypothetical protein C0993_007414, partial [Termitomyces sp. T159_Od127]
ALLEVLPPISTTLPAAEPPLAALPAAPIALAASAGPQAQILHLALLNIYDDNCASKEHFLQFCLTYIHLSRDAFDSDMLKIAWAL